MNMSVLVSVIVPVFNAERHIQRTLESLAKQTLTNIEVVVVDDASSDNTRFVVQQFQNRSQLNIVYLQQAENQGVHNARLLGLQHAKGEWIGFVDADDTLKPKMYETMLSAGLIDNVDIVVCGANRVAESGKRLSTKVRFRKEKKVTENVFQQFCQLKFGTGSLWNKLYRRDVIMPFKELYFPWRQDINEDMVLNIGCFSKAKSVLAIKDVYYNYTHNLNSVSSQIDTVLAFTETFKAYALALSCFSHFDKSMLVNITDLYRTQLEKPIYQVERSVSLVKYQEALITASQLINKVYPPGLALLSSRREPLIGVKKACAIILKRILKKFRLA